MITNQIKRDINLLLLIEELQFLCGLTPEEFDVFCPPRYRWGSKEKFSLLPKKRLTLRERSSVRKLKDNRYLVINVPHYQSGCIYVVFPDEGMFPVFSAIANILNAQLENATIEVSLDSEEWREWLLLVETNPSLPFSTAFRKLLASEAQGLLTEI
ncbi:hypothetical protein [Okeania sp. SIO2B3]|uniref:hypothetical protein n=1 Tax=Okeania sp. SIO2B3 TaxID=2607784 RepID=UPI0013BFDBE5|nr:hypothetical protein [Okeania sp. SIO2B3]NET40608.1 hypothetical protein [Okeania sp. SIO2B3]